MSSPTPTIWIQHSYPACVQHAPDEHLLAPLARQALQLMTGLMLISTGAHMQGQRNADVPARVRSSFGPGLVAEFIDLCHARPLKPGAREALIQRALAGDPQRYLDAFASIRRIDLRRPRSALIMPISAARPPLDAFAPECCVRERSRPTTPIRPPGRYWPKSEPR